MSDERIIKILDLHYIPHIYINGVLYADSMISGTKEFECVVKVADMTPRELYTWLGY